MEAGGLSNSFDNLRTKIFQDLKIYKENFNIFFILAYFYKIFYKLFKLIQWRIIK